ncbi:MAG: hypothetical protein ACRC2H_03500, partial [Silanimonas sp.]
MRPSLCVTRFPFVVALLAAALALGGCVMSAGGGAESNEDRATARDALPPPDMASAPERDAAPTTDASGRPLIEQPLSNDAVAVPAAGEVDYACTTDADCAVKDVGSCCGYSPACVNKDSPTFPEQVKAECAKNDMQSICGFRDIEGCTCIEGRCAAGPATNGE